MSNSNITIKSNIYPRDGYLSQDREFIKQVNNRYALSKLNSFISFNKMYDLTPIQRDIYEHELIKCDYNKEGDITHGSLLIDGKLRWVCRCEEIDCKHFKSCRPNITDEETEKIIERKIQHWEGLDKKKSLIEEQNRLAEERESIIARFLNEDQKNKKTTEESTVEHEEESIQETIPDESNTLVIDFIQTIETTEILDNIEEEAATTLEISYAEDIDAQYTVITSSYKERLLVDAPPGTGKTYTLIERIKNLILHQNIDPEELMVLSFSRSAIGEINKRIKAEINEEDSYWDLNGVDIRTFDSLATYIIRELEEDLSKSLYPKNYDERIEYGIKLIERFPEIFSEIKHLIVDEIQDLVGPRARLVKSIIKNLDCGFTLMGDMCQSIYDYQVRENNYEMDSKKFNKWLIDEYGNSIKKHTFVKNYRQIEELAKKTFVVREAILNKPEFYQKELVKNIVSGFEHLGKTINFDVNRFNKDEKTAILCRNNGQALKLSKELMHQGIDHIIQRPSNYRLLVPWLSEVFSYDEAVRINEDQFIERIHKIVPEIVNPYEYWKILKTIEGDRGSYIDIEYLCKELAYKAIQYEQILINRNANLVVSTIHKSKGREFDKVIILDEGILERSEDISEEVKIYYVALTRSKKRIKRISFTKELYANKNRNNENRWVSTYYYHKESKIKVFEIEVGREGDIDISSFISKSIFGNDEEILKNQQYIRENIRRNDKIQLRLNRDDKLYYIYHLGNKIGRMTGEFTNSIHKIHYMRFGDYTYMPDEINDIYVDEICSYIGDDRYFNLGSNYERKRIWLGISVIGFGTKKRYGRY